MKFIVYRLVNSRNGKSYVGISNRPVGVRFAEHLTRARQGMRRSRIYDAIRKYGADAFTHEVLATVATESEVRQLEIDFIARFDTYRNGYNSNLGGAGFLEFPQHIKDKISEAQKGKIISDESKKKMSDAKLGDSACAKNFGDFTSKGHANPKARAYLIRFPDGTEHVINGMRDFCREHGVTTAKLYTRSQTKGYSLLRRFNDQRASA